MPEPDCNDLVDTDDQENNCQSQQNYIRKFHGKFVQRKGSKSFWLLGVGCWPEFSTVTDLTTWIESKERDESVPRITKQKANCQSPTAQFSFTSISP